MVTDTVESDMGIGLGVLFSALAFVGAGVMVVGGFNQLVGAEHTVWQSTTAWAFAAAMTAASIAVVTVQAYWN